MDDQIAWHYWIFKALMSTGLASFHTQVLSLYVELAGDADVAKETLVSANAIKLSIS